MPNFDGGHYFLSVLAPLNPQVLKQPEGPPQACSQHVREVLATLPTAHQSPASEANLLNSPFARNRRTHFARFVVIDDVLYNGRNPTDAIYGALSGQNPIETQPVDRLTTPYLFFGADFDARDGSEEELRSYLVELWRDMKPELQAVFSHCVGFERVRDGNTFADYIQRCQVETTMPFNDYWSEPPPLKDQNLKTRLIPAGLAAAVAALSLVLWLLGNLGLQIGSWPWGWITVLALVVAALLLYPVYSYVLRQGAIPLPAAPNSDLPSVLKALYLQQHFVQFATRHQGADVTDLHRAFGEFIHQHRPDDRDQPTQPSGVIRTQGVR